MTVTGLAEAFVQALLTKDRAALARVVDPNVDFRGLSPNRPWEAHDLDGLSAVLDTWFETGDELEAVTHLTTGAVHDRTSLTYRFRGHNDKGLFLVEHHAYFTATDGRITWLRVLCSGFRYLPESAPSLDPEVGDPR